MRPNWGDAPCAAWLAQRLAAIHREQEANTPKIGDTLFANGRQLQTHLGQPDGALICPTGDAIRLALDLMADSREVEIVSPAVRGMLEAQHGKFHRFEPESIGCAIAPPGTPLRLVERFGPLSHVTADLPDGEHVDGYTMNYALALHRATR